MSFLDMKFMERCGAVIDEVYESVRRQLQSQLQSGAPSAKLSAKVPDNVPVMVAEAITIRLGRVMNRDMTLNTDTGTSYFLIEEKETAMEKKGKIPRPANAFILFRQHHHARVKAKYFPISNNDICELQPIPTSHCHLTLF
jgi:hypothetical protein